MDEASMQAAAQGGYPVGRVAVLPAVSSKQSLVSSTCTSQSGDNALDKSSTEAKGFNLKVCSSVESDASRLVKNK